MKQILELQTLARTWKQTVLFPMTGLEPVRGIDYEVFMKFYRLCPVWAIRYKNRKVNANWKQMEDPTTCVMGEFSRWKGGWSYCGGCKNFGFYGDDKLPGFYRMSDYNWRMTIPRFVRHVERYHPERLE